MRGLPSSLVKLKYFSSCSQKISSHHETSFFTANLLMGPAIAVTNKKNLEERKARI